MVGGLKDKIISIFKTNITKDYCVGNVYGGGKKPRKPKRKIKYENNIIKDVSYLVRLKKGNEAIKEPVELVIFIVNYIEYESNDDKNKTLAI